VRSPALLKSTVRLLRTFGDIWGLEGGTLNSLARKV
jgi:hypothetical protein